MITQAQQQFLTWFQSYDAPMYEVLMEQLKPGQTISLPSLGAVEDDVTPSFFDKIASGFTSAINAASKTYATIMPVYQAQRVSQAEYKLQITRARAGLAPKPTRPPANPLPVPKAKKKAIRKIALTAQRKAIVDARQPAYLRNVGMMLPIVAGGALLWMLTTKKKGR